MEDRAEAGLVKDRHWLFPSVAGLYGFGICILAGLLPYWGEWYSHTQHHRAQVSAFLSGSIEIATEPSALGHDLVWSEGGVHQVWGLGIPSYKLLCELLARCIGIQWFPEMLALALAMSLVAWGVLRAVWPLGTLAALSVRPAYVTGQRLMDGTWSFARLAWFVGIVELLLFFPPFLNLLQSRFAIYEEVVVYEYLVGLGLISGLLTVAQRTSREGYWVLCTVAGLGGFFRPTLVFHGAAAVVAGAVALGWGRGKVCNVGTTFRVSQQRAQRSQRDQPFLRSLCAFAAIREFLGPLSRLAGKVGRAEGSGLVEVQENPSNFPAGKPVLRWAQTVALGVGLFMLGGGLLFLTNYIRFGSGFEFGHRLNVQNLYGSLYATRFDDPYQDEPLLSAARELSGWLFLSREFNGCNFYEEHIFAGQSSTVRWREAYLTTYDLTYVPWLLAGLAAGVVAWWQWRRGALTPALSRPMGEDPRRVGGGCGPCFRLFRVFHAFRGSVGTGGSSPERLTPLAPFVVTLALFGGVGSSFLLVFYLRNPVISSRYLLDLMPSFAALMLAGWLGWGGIWLERKRGQWVLVASALLLLVWLGWQLSHSGSAYGPPRVLTWKEVVAHKSYPARPLNLVPSGFYASSDAPAETGIPFNGAGWEAPSGMVMPCLILFVDAPAFLELEIGLTAGEASGNGPVALRAKVGLEFLKRQSIVRSENGWVVRFAGPQRRRYQKGLQPVFLATVPKEHLADHQTPWRLLNVRWKKTEGTK